MKTQPLPVVAPSPPRPADRRGTEPRGDERAAGPTLDDATARAARFTGALSDLPVADLIQILQLAGKGASITLTHEGTQSHLWCAAGSIVDAESGRLRGEAAVYRILALEQGWLTAELQPSTRQRRIFAATQRLLLEAARRKDESVALRAKLGDTERCFRLADGVRPERLGQSAVELSLLRSFEPARSLSEAIETSELGDFETLMALASWLEGGQLVDAGTRRAPFAAEPPRAAQAVSLVPLVASIRPPRAPAAPAPPGRAEGRAWSSWLWSVAAALVLLPCGYFAGARAARVVPPAPVAEARADVATAPLLPLSYAVELQVEPAHAAITLDGAAVAVGRWQGNLARNGTPHELRVTATGFLPVTLWFADAAPPTRVTLEPTPAPTLSRNIPTAISGDAVKAVAVEPASDASKTRKRPGVARAAVRRESARMGLRSRSRVIGSALSVANTPQVPTTEPIDPIIRRLD